MEIAKLILEFLKTLIWPMTIGVIIWSFRKYLRELLNSVTKFKGFGIDAEFEKRIGAQLKQIKDEIINTDENATESEKRITKMIAEELNKAENKFKSEQNSSIETQTENTIKADEKNGENTMLAFAVNESIENNKKYNIYYDPALRNHNYPFKYIGLYEDKEIVAVGQVKKIVYCDYDEEKKKLIPTDGKILDLNDDEYNRIKNIIINTPYYELKTGNKFFLVDNFYSTHFKKSSDYALRAKKYFWLNEIEGYRKNMTAAQLAELINGKDWQ